MKKTIVEILNKYFETLEGTTDILDIIGNKVEVWDYEGDNLIFSITYEDDILQITKWHKDNKSAKNIQDYISPTESETVEIIKNNIK